MECLLELGLEEQLDLDIPIKGREYTRNLLEEHEHIGEHGQLYICMYITFSIEGKVENFTILLHIKTLR